MIRHATSGIPFMLAAGAAGLAELVTGWVRLGVLAGGGVVTMMVGFYLWRRRRYEAITARMEMCRVCQAMRGGPKYCSVPSDDRPPHCPASEPELLPH